MACSLWNFGDQYNLQIHILFSPWVFNVDCWSKGKGEEQFVRFWQSNVTRLRLNTVLKGNLNSLHDIYKESE